MRIRSSWALALGLVALGGSAAPVRAGLYRVDYSGTVVSVDASLAGTFSPGQAITGSYVFESTTPATSGSTATIAVFNALKSFQVTVGTYSASSAAAAEIQVDDNPGLPFHDRYGVISRASQGLTGGAVGGNPLLAAGFRLDDSTDTRFSTAMALPTSVSLAGFDSNAFFLFFNTFADLKLVTGTLTSVSTTAIPEPATVTLCVLGGLGLLGYRCRRGRRA